MSLFIAGLAFPEHPERFEQAKIGILAGSVLSALIGWLVLRLAKTPAIEVPTMSTMSTRRSGSSRRNSASSGLVAEQLELDPRVFGDTRALLGLQHLHAPDAGRGDTRSWRAAALWARLAERSESARAGPTFPRGATLHRR